MTKTISPNAGHDYVLAVMKRPSMSPDNVCGEILTILKDRPAWQKGRINLPGGRVEDGETPEQAAVREIKEETGYDTTFIRQIGLMNDGMFKIDTFRVVPTNFYDGIVPRPEETEVASWVPIRGLLKDPRLLPNLRFILPVSLYGIEGFEISDQARSEYGKLHSFTVSVPTYDPEATSSDAEFLKELESL